MIDTRKRKISQAGSVLEQSVLTPGSATFGC